MALLGYRSPLRAPAGETCTYIPLAVRIACLNIFQSERCLLTCELLFVVGWSSPGARPLTLVPAPGLTIGADQMSWTKARKKEGTLKPT